MTACCPHFLDPCTLIPQSPQIPWASTLPFFSENIPRKVAIESVFVSVPIICKLIFMNSIQTWNKITMWNLLYCTPFWNELWWGLCYIFIKWCIKISPSLANVMGWNVYSWNHQYSSALEENYSGNLKEPVTIFPRWNYYFYWSDTHASGVNCAFARSQSSCVSAMGSS